MADQNSLIVKLPYTCSSASAINRTNQTAISKAPRAAASASSSQQAAPAKIATHFSQSQLALALAIQKAKPEALSTHEYCQQLRKCIKAGRPVLIDGLRFVDTCDFWKEQYTKIHLENKALQDKVHRLEQAGLKLPETPHGQYTHHMLHILSGQFLPEPGDVGRTDTEGSRKRRAPVAEDRAEYQEQGYMDFSSSKDICFSMSNYVLRIGRQRSNMERAAQDSSTLDHVNILARNIFQTLTLLESTLFSTCLPLKLLRTDSEDHRTSLLIQHVMHQVKTSFLSCFRAMNELCVTIPGRARMPETVYRMVMFYKKALGLLHRLANAQAEFETVQEHQRPRNKRSRMEEREYIVTKSLANSLASIALGIEWIFGQPGHADLLEGILFCVLEQTGRLVSEVIFAEHVATSDNPGNISKVDDQIPGGNIHHDSRYMVQILQAAVGGSKRRELIAQVLAAGNSNSSMKTPPLSSTLSLALSSDLLSKAKKLLQSTLVNCAVGGPGLESLRLPTPPIEEVDIQVEVDDQAEKYGSEWLVQSVWGIIGWDMIA